MKKYTIAFISLVAVVSTIYVADARLSNPVSLRGVRWASPYHTAVTVTSQTFVAGTVFAALFEVTQPVVADQMCYVVGGVAQGSVRMGIYGPVVTEETMLTSPLLATTASTSQSAISINSPHCIDLTTNPELKQGRYYMVLQGADATGTYMRNSNTAQVTGWGQSYARGGGYGAFTDPAPAMTNTGSAIPGIRVRFKVQ